MKALLGPYAKAIAAALVGALGSVAATVGLDLSDAQTATLVTAATTVVVWLIPNVKVPQA